MREALISERVLTEDGLREAAVVFEDGVIREILRREDLPPDVRVHERGGSVIMAGLVDCHVHVNEPGRTEWEGFDTATAAAASGGVTTLVDMPLNCQPVTTTRDALMRKVEAATPALHVDVGFWGGVVPGNAGDLTEMAEAGILGAKAFLCHSGIDDFPRAEASDLREAMPRLRDAGIPLLAHAELELAAEAREAPPRRYRSWLEARPAAWEDAAIALLITLCRETRCPVHIVHLSSATALPMIAEARAEGLPLTVETCPHYLCLRAEDVPDGATEYKCAPPIRGEANRQGLWRGLLEGTIDLVVSDHSPCIPSLKHPEEGDFLAAWGGIASLGLGLASVWTEARRHGATLEDVSRWMSREPARLAGLGKKGAIAPGRDADFVVFDPDERFDVEEKALRFRHPVSPYLGRSLTGRVRETWLGGRRIHDDDGLVRGRGRPQLWRHDQNEEG